MIKAFLADSGIQHSLIHAYSKEENGLVERANKEVNRHITSMAYDRQIRAQWKDSLPFVQRIMNTQVHNSIGVSPSQLIFGNAINHDAHFLTKPVRDTSLRTYNERVVSLHEAQARLIDIAQRNQFELDTFHVARRDTGVTTSFPINSYVLAEYETQKPSKFPTKLHGPYRVVSSIGSVYTLENLVTHAYTDFHVKLLREFLHDPEYTNPEEVARHDKEYDEILQIIDHRFTSTKKRRTDLEFQLIWAKTPIPVWERWNPTLAANEKVHDYLSSHQLRRLIPQQYTWPKDHALYTPPEKPTLPVRKRKRRKKDY